MSRYTVGFDLGTHQTKICIQDALNPAEKIYEFLEFEKRDGTTTVLLPSLVQINKDHTLSYGFYDKEECLILENPEIPLPELITQQLPTLKLTEFPEIDTIAYTAPPKAVKADIDNIDTKEYSPLEKWQKQANQTSLVTINHWKECILTELRDYIRTLKNVLFENTRLQCCHEVDMAIWQENMKPRMLRFRYFKQASLTTPELWSEPEFTANEITVWYITYVLLLLKEKLGEDFTVQFGVPCGASNSERDRSLKFASYRLFITAADLAAQFKSIKDYEGATFEELKEKTIFKTLTYDVIQQYYFDDMPEAFAGLVSVTSQKKLGMGFHLLVDIGGGTTDLALFTVTKDLTPNVHSVVSIPYGLNFIFEMRQKDCSSSLHQIQQSFRSNPSAKAFKGPITLYKTELKKEGEATIKRIIQSFSKSYTYHGMKMSRLTNALIYQPLIYCGGGSMFTQLFTNIGSFTDMRRLSKENLDIRNLINDDSINPELYPILSVSYGLASYEKDYDKDIECVDLADVFETFLPKANLHGHSNDTYEHGLTDIE